MHPLCWGNLNSEPRKGNTTFEKRQPNPAERSGHSSGLRPAAAARAPRYPRMNHRRTNPRHGAARAPRGGGAGDGAAARAEARGRTGPSSGAPLLAPAPAQRALISAGAGTVKNSTTGAGLGHAAAAHAGRRRAAETDEHRRSTGGVPGHPTPTWLPCPAHRPRARARRTCEQRRGRRHLGARAERCFRFRGGGGAAAAARATLPGGAGPRARARVGARGPRPRRAPGVRRARC